MSLDFSDFLGALSSDIWDDYPVDLNTFLYSKEYLALDIVLSPIQFEIVTRGSQILHRETLEDLYPEYEDLIKPYCRELILCVGKGSGKDMLSQLICLYIVYQLLCLKNPAGYFGKPMGDSIDIVNVAINARQANNVFFKGLRTRLKYCPWFAGKYNARNSDVVFDKGVTLHSLNSEGEGTEGLNILVAVLDEIDGFDENDPLSPNANKMYDTLTATVTSRFENNGKVLLLSFPRRKDGFMMKRYNKSISEKNVIRRTHTFQFDPSLPVGTEGNEFTIEWDEDHIISYKFPGVWALRRPTWDINQTKTIDTFKTLFHEKLDDSLGRFAADPTENDENTWFPDKAKIDATFRSENGLSKVTGDADILIKPQKDKLYFIHVDLARVQDNCAISMAHVEKFVKPRFEAETEIQPYVVVDLVKYWKPDRKRPIDFADVREFIISLRRAGFNIKFVTFDRWNSDLTIEQLNSVGIKADKYSVDQHTYAELALLMGQNMVEGPDEELLRNELKKLVVLPNGKVDHTNKSSKDLSDAVCGAVYGASTYTPRPSTDFEVQTYADIIRMNRQSEMEKKPEVVITKREMPDDIASWLDDLKIL